MNEDQLTEFDELLHEVRGNGIIIGEEGCDDDRVEAQFDEIRERFKEFVEGLSG
jgi:hypothetical protein